MSLLLDNNLSPRLLDRLADLYPDSSHVVLLGLQVESDFQVWETARNYGFCLVTKASDFNEMLIAKGFPPKVIWITSRQLRHKAN